MKLLNDVHSALNPTAVAAVARPRCLADLKSLVRRAAVEGRAISLAGGRHAMGAQQFGTGTLHLDTTGLDRVLDLDVERGLLTAEAGILWPELIAASHRLQGDEPRWGIAQKQTGADRLSLGGALAANVHGRGLAMRPLIADVESFVLVDASGEARLCSREQDTELFRLAIGGYGLFGVVYCVTLRLAPRVKIRRDVELLSTDRLMSAFDERIADGCLYGDFQFAIDPASEQFLRQGVFSCYRPVADETPAQEETRALSPEAWKELLYLAHADKSEGFRRYAEHYLATDGQVYRSDTHQLGVYVDGYHAELDARLGAHHPASEVITEVYVPRTALRAFLEDAREDFRANGVDVIYGTVRLIERDDESVLAWAREPWACTVFNLHVEHTPRGEAKAGADFRRLIDLALRRGGSYYLTYHRHATRAQVEAAHPRFREFLAAKNAHDPEGRFRSDWHRHHERLLRRGAREAVA